MNKLEQLEHLRFEDIPHRPMITPTIDQFILDPKSKQDKVKVTNLKNLPKLQIFQFGKKTLYMRHTFWSGLIRCAIWNESDNCRRYKVGTILFTDGQKDRRMDKVYPQCNPFNFIERGIIRM